MMLSGLRCCLACHQIDIQSSETNSKARRNKTKKTGNGNILAKDSIAESSEYKLNQVAHVNRFQSNHGHRLANDLTSPETLMLTARFCVCVFFFVLLNRCGVQHSLTRIKREERAMQAKNKLRSERKSVDLIFFLSRLFGFCCCCCNLIKLLTSDQPTLE